MAKPSKSRKNWDDESHEVESNFISWGQEGDFIYGALLSPRRQVPNRLAEKPGTMQYLYEVKVHECSYHKLDKKKRPVEDATKPEEGDIIIVGGKAGYDHKLAHLKVGQLFGLKFIEEQESKVAGRNPTKIFKVYLPKDEDGEYLFDEDVKAPKANEESEDEDDGDEDDDW